jgi:alpha-beta hydrolase superfamily lysophospholipase
MEYTCFMRFISTFTLLCFLSACSSTSAAPTAAPILITPVESAFAPDNPTAAPPDEIIASHSVGFTTPDGATITGELYGTGTTAVIFSVMGNCKPGWREFAQLPAAHGLMTLTYPWRGCRESGSANETELKLFVDDLRGAINFMRANGAKRIILAGASLGGVASAKLAVESQASGIVVLASPAVISEWGFEVESTDLNTDIPKLFIIAENDSVVPIESAHDLFDLALEPKEWQTYPSTAHGTDLFETEYGEDVQNRILEFILEITNQ